MEAAAAGRSRTVCVALHHHPSGARLLMQCQTEPERGSWIDLAVECVERSKVYAAEQAVIEAEAGARARVLAMQVAEEQAQASAARPSPDGGDQPFGQLVCPTGGQPLQVHRRLSDGRSPSSRSLSFSLAPAVEASPNTRDGTLCPMCEEMESTCGICLALPPSTGDVSNAGSGHDVSDPHLNLKDGYFSWNSWGRSQKAVAWVTGAEPRDPGGVAVGSAAEEGVPPDQAEGLSGGPGGAGSTGSRAPSIVEMDEDVRDLTLEALSSSVILTEDHVAGLHRMLPFTEQVQLATCCCLLPGGGPSWLALTILAAATST